MVPGCTHFPRRNVMKRSAKQSKKNLKTYQDSIAKRAADIPISEKHKNTRHKPADCSQLRLFNCWIQGSFFFSRETTRVIIIFLRKKNCPNFWYLKFILTNLFGLIFKLLYNLVYFSLRWLVGFRSAKAKGRTTEPHPLEFLLAPRVQNSVDLRRVHTPAISRGNRSLHEGPFQLDYCEPLTAYMCICLCDRG